MLGDLSGVRKASGERKGGISVVASIGHTLKSLEAASTPEKSGLRMAALSNWPEPIRLDG